MSTCRSVTTDTTRRALLTVIAVGVLAVCAVAQNQAIVTGDVVNKDGKPIAGIQITLTNRALGIFLPATTNGMGMYSFFVPNPAAGYVVTACAQNGDYSFDPPTKEFRLLVGERHYVLPPFAASANASGKRQPCGGPGKVPVAVAAKPPSKPVTTATATKPAGTATSPKPTPVTTAKKTPPPAPVEKPAATPPATKPAAEPTVAAAPAPTTPPVAPPQESASAPAAVQKEPEVVAPTPPPQVSSGEAVTAEAKAPPDVNPTPPAPSAPPQQAPQATVPPAPMVAELESPPIQLQAIASSQSTVITAEQLRILPLYNRNFLALGLLAANTHDVQAGSELSGATFSISGQRPTQNSFLLDGMDNIAASSNQAIPFQVNDAIQEFRVTTATAGADVGRYMGGVVNIVTQRGTSDFHGSVFGFFGSDAFNAQSPLSVYNGTTFDQARAYAGPLNAKPVAPYQTGQTSVYEPTSYNQYVATAQALNPNVCTSPAANPPGGNCNPRFDPAALLAADNSHFQPFSSQQFGGQAGGSLAKKWFWFGDYEGTRINNPNPIFERVPSLYDRNAAQTFAGTSGYADAMLANRVLSLYPTANVVAVPDVLEFYQGIAPNYTNVDNYMGRLDFNQSNDSNWVARYNLQNLSQLHDDSLPSSTFYPGNGAIRAALNQNLSITFTHRFSDRLTSISRAGWTRFQVKETPQDAYFNASQVGLPNGQLPTFLLSGLDTGYSGASKGNYGAFAGWYDSFWSPTASTNKLMSPSLDGLFPFARIGAPLSAPGERQDSRGEFVQQFSMFLGRHSLNMGVEGRILSDVFNNGGFSRGYVASGNIGEFTSDSETCMFCQQSAFSDPSFDYALKQPTPYQTTLHSYAIGGYVQDSWRVASNLVVNLGLRYDYFSIPTEINDQLWNYVPSVNGLVQQGHNQVLDSFGNDCATSGYGTLDSVYPSNSVQLPWNCKPTATGSFLTASSTNFQPRVGVAWSVTPTTVVRAGFGIYVAQIATSPIAQLTFNRPNLLNFTRPQALYGQSYESAYCFEQCGMGNTSLVSLNSATLSSQAASVPFGISAIAPQKFGNPYTRQVSFAVEQALGRWVSATATYVGNFSYNLPVISNTGFNNEWFCTASAPVIQPGQPRCDTFSYQPIFTLANSGNGSYNAMVLSVRTSGWHGLQANASYTYSKGLDNASSANFPLLPTTLMTQLYSLQYFGNGNLQVFGLGNGTRFTSPPVNAPAAGQVPPMLSGLSGLLTAGLTTTGAGQVYVTPYTIPQDPYGFLKNDYGPSDYNQPNRFLLDFVWAIPSKSRNQWISGWTVSGIFVAQNGQPFTIFSGPVLGEMTQRVNLTGKLVTTGNPADYISRTSGITLPSATCATGPALSPYVTGTTQLFSGTAGSPCLGNTGRNAFTGPGYVDFDMALQKQVKLGERLGLLLRAESYDLFNHPNYYNPISTYSLDGITPYSQFGQIKSAHDPRKIQLGVRLNW